MTRRYVSPEKIARIRYWRDVLVIDAPDYIHRQVGGYPKPIPPDAAPVDGDDSGASGESDRWYPETEEPNEPAPETQDEDRPEDGAGPV